MAVATVISAAQRCLSSWCIRSGHFLSIGFGLFVLCLVTVIAQLTLGHVLSQLSALIWGYVCALGFQTACLAAADWQDRHPRWISRVSRRGMRRAAYNTGGATYMVGYALASSVRDRLIQIMLGWCWRGCSWSVRVRVPSYLRAELVDL